MAKRWKQRPQDSNWGDWGDDDELGRVNMITPEKVLEGVREISAGRSFALSLPLDLPGGSSLNQRRYPPILRPTEDLKHKPDVFYNVVGRDRLHYSFTDVWSDDLVTLWLQYSTQWDALVHQGALFDADGDGVEEPVYYNGFRPDEDVIGPQEDAKGDGSGSLSFARHLGLEHMAAHGVQGRAVLIDIAHHLGNTEEWTAVSWKTLREIIDADKVEIRPGDMVILHTGYATKILEWNGKPDASRIQAMYPYLDAQDDGILQWILDSGLSALAADNYAVEGFAPASREPHTLLPIHKLCLFKLGIPLGELWYLHDLAAWLRENNRTSFLLTAPPLRLPGAAGGPLTPIATV
ncbi:cyclase family protein [Frankia sp. CNm7]|uniref:Cyclase family protein n=1 Tax=Frankia nepalensis TaxID=1836974 RepID=A0A937R8G6_9ACTN|nr:cyclase family protein [Frankia nepalensis]MBL7502354.1 cyclase family protein [Frankia nepalensis]MBL7516193.1 cyclase family protein [Frankia nepalensis]MBL7519865.1 cyclase family protein [Frankia nepalensis]MBL7625687.1 cyclase family protein [Frankia nepalensis]